MTSFETKKNMLSTSSSSSSFPSYDEGILNNAFKGPFGNPIVSTNEVVERFLDTFKGDEKFNYPSLNKMKDSKDSKDLKEYDEHKSSVDFTDDQTTFVISKQFAMRAIQMALDSGKTDIRIKII